MAAGGPAAGIPAPTAWTHKAASCRVVHRFAQSGILIRGAEGSGGASGDLVGSTDLYHRTVGSCCDEANGAVIFTAGPSGTIGFKVLDRFGRRHLQAVLVLRGHTFAAIDALET